jgi:hypothetical protein
MLSSSSKYARGAYQSHYHGAVALVLCCQGRQPGLVATALRQARRARWLRRVVVGAIWICCLAILVKAVCKAANRDT